MASARVVVVDDEPGYAELVGARLEGLEDVTVVETAADPQDALEVIRRSAVDCVVSDYDMPKIDGLELFDAVRDAKPDISYVLVTGVGDDGLARRVREAGVTACVRKDGGRNHYHRLVAAVRDAAARNGTGVDSPATLGRSGPDRRNRRRRR